MWLRCQLFFWRARSSAMVVLARILIIMIRLSVGRCDSLTSNPNALSFLKNNVRSFSPPQTVN